MDLRPDAHLIALLAQAPTAVSPASMEDGKRYSQPVQGLAGKSLMQLEHYPRSQNNPSISAISCPLIEKVDGV